jgi:hypothetical protein
MIVLRTKIPLEGCARPVDEARQSDWVRFHLHGNRQNSGQAKERRCPNIEEIRAALGRLLEPQLDSMVADLNLLKKVEHGLATLSLGYLIGRRDAVDWRGHLASGTLLQFI